MTFLAILPALALDPPEGVHACYAIITLKDVLESPYTLGWMALSEASGSTIDNYEHGIRGYPGSRVDCSANEFGQRPPNGFTARWQFYADGPIEKVYSRSIAFNISTGKGFSGGLYYYCPNGPCDDGHYQTAVHSAGGGPAWGVRASEIRDWVAYYAFNYL